MFERAPGRSSGSAKPFAQDVLGFVLCGLGGFSSVSIVLALLGWRSRGGIWTWPVEELMELLGPWAALLFSAALAVLGTVLFLQSSPLSPGRPLVALTLASLGLAFLIGAFGTERGGLVGSAFPSLLGGFPGGLVAAALGVATLLLSFVLGSGTPRAGGSKPAPAQRIELSARSEAASGVSPAEAALLVTEPVARPGARKTPEPTLPGTAVQPLPRSTPTPTGRPASASIRDETIRPYTPPGAPDAPRDRRSQAQAADAPGERPDPDLAAPVPLSAGRARASVPGTAPQRGPATGAAVPALQDLGSTAPSSGHLPVPAWEAALAGDPLGAPESMTVASSTRGVEAPEEPASQPPVASWEQIGLFDEEEAPEAEEPVQIPEQKPEVQASGTSALEAEQVQEALRGFEELEEEEEELDGIEEDEHGSDPELSAERSEDPFAGPAQELLTPEPAEAEQEDAGEHGDFLISPAPATAAPPAKARRHASRRRPASAARTRPDTDPAKEALDPEGERWRALVFDAGCLIVEQNRVAVSMLERRFEIDFEQACRVLDELQQAGLIGPYMGGRTRDILLTREEWLAHAPGAT
jgi:hypothetical protein